MMTSVSKRDQSVCVVAKLRGIQHTEWCWSVLLLPVQIACSTSVGASLKDLWGNVNYILKWHHFKDLKNLKSEIQHTLMLVSTSCQTRKWQNTQFRNHWALAFLNFFVRKRKKKTFRVSNGGSKHVKTICTFRLLVFSFLFSQLFTIIWETLQVFKKVIIINETIGFPLKKCSLF